MWGFQTNLFSTVSCLVVELFEDAQVRLLLSLSLALAMVVARQR